MGFSGTPVIPVRQNKRSNMMRRLGQMNGDYLLKLKDVARSEMSQSVRGSNAAATAQLKKRLDWWFKEQNINLGKLRRGQFAVHNTMMRVYREKKKLQRKSHERHQAEMRQDLERSQRHAKSPPRQSIMSLPGILETQSGEINEETDHLKSTLEVLRLSEDKAEPKSDADVIEQVMAANKSESDPESPRKLNSPALEADNTNEGAESVSEARTHGSNLLSRVIEVRKEMSNLGYPTVGVSHRTISEADIKFKQKQQSGQNENDVKGLVTTNSSRDSGFEDGPIKETARAVYISTGVDKSQQANITERLPDESRAEISKKPKTRKHNTPPTGKKHGLGKLRVPKWQRKEPPPLTYLLSHRKSENIITNQVIDIVAEESEKSPTSTKQRSKGSVSISGEFKSKDHDGKRGSQPETLLGERLRTKSLREKNGQGLLELYRKYSKQEETMLHKELNRPFPVYSRNISGDIVPTGMTIKKKDFAKPSDRERYVRKKLLEREHDHFAEQRSRVNVFYESIQKYISVEQTGSPSPPPRPQQPPLEVDINKKDKENQAIMGMTLSHYLNAFRPEPLPDDIDPNSVDALKRCKYLREYRGHEEDLPEEQSDKRVSSWGHAYLASHV